MKVVVPGDIGVFVMGKSPPDKPVPLGLTPREWEVMCWAKKGKSAWVISRILGCEEETVKKHFQHVYRKLEVENRIEAINALERFFPPEEEMATTT